MTAASPVADSVSSAASTSVALPSTARAPSDPTPVVTPGRTANAGAVQQSAEGVAASLSTWKREIVPQSGGSRGDKVNNRNGGRGAAAPGRGGGSQREMDNGAGTMTSRRGLAVGTASRRGKSQWATPAGALSAPPHLFPSASTSVPAPTSPALTRTSCSPVVSPDVKPEPSQSPRGPHPSIVPYEVRKGNAVRPAPVVVSSQPPDITAARVVSAVPATKAPAKPKPSRSSHSIHASPVAVPIPSLPSSPVVRVPSSFPATRQPSINALASTQPKSVPSSPLIPVVAPFVPVSTPAPIPTTITSPFPSASVIVAPGIPVVARQPMPERNRVASGGQRAKPSANDLEEKMRNMKLKNEAAEKRHLAILAEASDFASIAATEEALTATILAKEKVERERVWESQREEREAREAAEKVIQAQAAAAKELAEKEAAQLKRVEADKRKEKEKRTAEVQATINAEQSLTASRKLELVQSRAWDREKLDSPLPPSLTLSLSKAQLGSSTSSGATSKAGTPKGERELNYPSIELERVKQEERENGVAFVQGVKEENGWDSVEQDPEQEGDSVVPVEVVEEKGVEKESKSEGGKPREGLDGDAQIASVEGVVAA